MRVAMRISPLKMEMLREGEKRVLVQSKGKEKSPNKEDQERERVCLKMFGFQNQAMNENQ